MTAALKKDDAERRREHRVRSVLQGRVIYNGGNSAFDCIVRDLSQQGAKVQFSAAVALPQKIELDIPNRGERKPAIVRWRHEDLVGLEFADARDHDYSTDEVHALLDRMHRLEGELARMQLEMLKLKGDDEA